jgi:hypothetical protein
LRSAKRVPSCRSSAHRPLNFIQFVVAGPSELDTVGICGAVDRAGYAAEAIGRSVGARLGRLPGASKLVSNSAAARPITQAQADAVFLGDAFAPVLDSVGLRDAHAG